MKRRILLPLLVSLLIIPLVFSGCFGSAPADNTDTTPIGLLTTRVTALETTVGQLANRPQGITADQLAPYALKTELPSPTDLSGYVTDAELSNFIANLTDAQIATLKGKLGLSDTNGTTPPIVTGQVTAVFDPIAPAIVSGSGLPIQQFKVVITNGTSTWQYVSYSLILTCKTSPPTTGATVADLVALKLNTVFGTSLEFTPNFVESTSGGPVMQITFYPDKGVAVAPGVSSSSILNYLNFNLPGGVAIQEWNCIIIPVYSTSNW